MNANRTITTKRWYNYWAFTWGDDALNPKCEHLEIPVGYQFMTSNLGLRYDVTSVIFNRQSANGTSLQEKRGSISYLNNTLTNCQVDGIDINLKKSDSSIPDPTWYGWWSWLDSSADIQAHCDIVNDEGPFTVSFSTTYQTTETVFDTISTTKLYNYVAIDNFTSHASVWWGTRMLTNYFVGTQHMMASTLHIDATNTTYAQGRISYTGTDKQSIFDNDIFGLDYFLIDTAGGAVNSDNDMADVSKVYNNASFELSPPLTEGLWFARVFQSLVLVDLGNSQAPNLLLDSSSLKTALNSTGDFNRHGSGALANATAFNRWKFADISSPGDLTWTSSSGVSMEQAYSKFSNLDGDMGSLGTRDATIYAQYICSESGRKSNGTVIMLIIVANYALFQTFWAIFKYWWDERSLHRNGETAMCCEGCYSVDHHDGIVPHTENNIEFSPMNTASAYDQRFSMTSSTKALLKHAQKDELHDEDEHIESLAHRS